MGVKQLNHRFNDEPETQEYNKVTTAKTDKVK